jgi:hypothetical protein
MAVKLHDWFNLVVIGMLNIMNTYYLLTGERWAAGWRADGSLQTKWCRACVLGSGLQGRAAR